MSTRARCHCGAVELELLSMAPLSTARRCDCSFCKRRQAANVSVPLADLRVISGQDALSCYQWGTGTARHYFCSRCGIYTHHQRRSRPDEYGVNIYCIDGVAPSDHEPLGWNDGVNYALNED
ncbi:MAG: GFA family protein [Pseudomonadota bacterium]